MTSTAEDLFRKLGERYVAKGKPVTTHAVLMALRFKESSGGWKMLKQANLLEVEPPQEEDEGDAGIFSPSLARALTSAAMLAQGSPTWGTQHLLGGLLREGNGVAGRWLRANGFCPEELNWSEYSDPEPEPKKPPKLLFHQLGFTFFLAAILWAGLGDGLGPLYGLFILLYLPSAVLLWLEPQLRTIVPNRCWRCSCEPELPAMRNPKTGLCPPCQRWIYKIPARNYLWLVLVLAAVGAASIQFNQSIAFIVGNILLAIVLDIPVTVIHEAGHWLAGRLAGLRLISIHIGRGAVRRCIKLGSVWCYFQWAV